MAKRRDSFCEMSLFALYHEYCKEDILKTSLGPDNRFEKICFRPIRNCLAKTSWRSTSVMYPEVGQQKLSIISLDQQKAIRSTGSSMEASTKVVLCDIVCLCKIIDSFSVVSITRPGKQPYDHTVYPQQIKGTRGAACTNMTRCSRHHKEKNILLCNKIN